jgi:hypothetical protein
MQATVPILVECDVTAVHVIDKLKFRLFTGISTYRKAVYTTLADVQATRGFAQYVK